MTPREKILERQIQEIEEGKILQENANNGFQNEGYTEEEQQQRETEAKAKEEEEFRAKQEEEMKIKNGMWEEEQNDYEERWAAEKEKQAGTQETAIEDAQKAADEAHKIDHHTQTPEDGKSTERGTNSEEQARREEVEEQEAPEGQQENYTASQSGDSWREDLMKRAEVYNYAMQRDGHLDNVDDFYKEQSRANMERIEQATSHSSNDIESYLDSRIAEADKSTERQQEQQQEEEQE